MARVVLLWIISLINANNKLLLLNMAAEGEGVGTRQATGLKNFRVERSGLNIRIHSFSQKVANWWTILPNALKSRSGGERYMQYRRFERSLVRASIKKWPKKLRWSEISRWGEEK